MTAWYCSSTEPCFVKIKRSRWFSELAVRLRPLEKEQCGEKRKHRNVCECASQTRSTQHASFSNQRVMYSTTVTLFSQIDRWKPCAAAGVGTGRWDKKVRFSHWLSFFLQITEYKCTSYKRVVNGYYIPLFFIIFKYIVEHQETPMTTATETQSEDTSPHTFFVFFVTRLKKTHFNLSPQTVIHAPNVCRDLIKLFSWSSGKGKTCYNFILHSMDFHMRDFLSLLLWMLVL